MTKKTITQATLKKYLHYDPATGIFTWIWHHNIQMRGRIVGKVVRLN